MHPLISSALYWRGFIAKLLISCLVTIALAVSSALSGVDNWGALTRTQQIIIICGIVGVAGNNIISLLDRTFAEKSNGHTEEPPEAVIDKPPPTP